MGSYCPTKKTEIMTEDKKELEILLTTYIALWN